MKKLLLVGFMLLSACAPMDENQRQANMAALLGAMAVNQGQQPVLHHTSCTPRIGGGFYCNGY